MNLDNKKILIGDDSALARKQLKDTLSDMGNADIVEAVNGQEAIDLYKKENPDLVFLDIVTPEKDGVAATAEIMEYDSSASIIIVSSLGTQNQLTAAIKAGAKEFIQKPFRKEQIENLIAKQQF